MYIFGSDIAQIYSVDASAVVYVEPHARFGSYIVYGRRRIGGEHACRMRSLPYAAGTATSVDVSDKTHYLKKPWAAAAAEGLERRRHGEADGLVGTAAVGYDQTGI